VSYRVFVKIVAPSGLFAEAEGEYEALRADEVPSGVTLLAECAANLDELQMIAHGASQVVSAMDALRADIAAMSDMRLGLFHAYAIDRADGTAELYAEELRRRGFRPGARGKKRDAAAQQDETAQQDGTDAPAQQDATAEGGEGN